MRRERRALAGCKSRTECRVRAEIDAREQRGRIGAESENSTGATGRMRGRSARRLRSDGGGRSEARGRSEEGVCRQGMARTEIDARTECKALAK